MPGPDGYAHLDRAGLVEVLRLAGCVAAEEEAEELMGAAAGDGDVLSGLVRRRVAGEPLAWVTGWAPFCGRRVKVLPGVYVPRWQTEPLARRACELLPDDGMAVDLCTGSGAIAMVLMAARPRARVLATELDPVACRCAAANGVDVLEGDLGEPLPRHIWGQVDVVVGVVPYVPSEEMAFLPRDVRQHEPRAAWDGGPGGTRALARGVAWGARLLKAGGALLLEMGGEQDRHLAQALSAHGFAGARRLVDEDGDLRGLVAFRAGVTAAPGTVARGAVRTWRGSLGRTDRT